MTDNYVMMLFAMIHDLSSVKIVKRVELPSPRHSVTCVSMKVSAFSHIAKGSWLGVSIPYQNQTCSLMF